MVYSDLLVRHERLVHPAEASHTTKHRSHPARTAAAVSPAPTTPSSTATSQPSAPPLPTAVPPRLDPEPSSAIPLAPSQVVEQPQFNQSWGYDLNLLSHAASHVALEGQRLDPTPSVRKQPVPDPKPILDGYGVDTSMLDLNDLGDPVQDFTVFLESVGLASDWDSGLRSSIEPDSLLPVPQQYDLSKTPITGQDIGIQRFSGTMLPDQRNITDEPSYSNTGSRLPSLQPEQQEDVQSSLAEGPIRVRSPWDVSIQDRQLFILRLENFNSVLPSGFNPPSRPALSRFLAGYINGLNEHLPFIHIPTLSVARCSPELSLALAAAGCHYRFENNRGIELFQASKAILLERIRRRDAAHSQNRSWGQPVNATPTGNASQSSYSPTVSASGQNGTFSQPYAEYLDSTLYQGDADCLMDIIRTFLLLTVFASWERHPDLLREMLALQSTLARLVRDHGLIETSPPVEGPEWEDWARDESNRRTKLIVYCFFNLHSIMYNIPPLILNSELKLNMPCPADEWRANTPVSWRRLHQSRITPISSFQEALANLFVKNSPTPATPTSPLGNYVLIHAITQQIFFARQLRLSFPTLPGTSLRRDDLYALETALRAWEAGWRRAPESSIDPQSPAGPVAFTSTALLGLAYIRLHLDLGPCRALVTQDPMQIALALRSSAPLDRHPRLIMPLLHSAHALSIPVRLGIDFVARTHSFFWSIQHSICSLECAFLLSRWLLAIPSTHDRLPLSEHERKLLLWVKSMMDETEMVADVTNTPELEFLADFFKVRQLSVAIVRVWSRTFKGNTSWPIVDLIGEALEIYAGFLENEG